MADSNKKSIVCFGEVLWDMLPSGKVAGGAPMNVAYHINNFGLKVKLNDIIKTEAGGQAQVALNNGNNLYVASGTEIQLTEEVVGKKEKGFTQIIKLFYGKIRAKIQKTRKQRFVVKTTTATIGVKGTDFITEFADEQTRVGTLEGLVNLLSDKTQESVDVPPGSMGSVSIVIPLHSEKPASAMPSISTKKLNEL